MISSTASTSPSRSMRLPAVVVMLRMSGSEALQGRGLVGVDLEEVMRAGHRQHRLDALLQAGQLDDPPGQRRLTMEIHQAADGGAVDVSHRAQVDDNAFLAATDELGRGAREVRQNRIRQARL